MFLNALDEANNTIGAFRAECAMLTDSVYLTNRIRNYVLYTDQLCGAETDASEASAPIPKGKFKAELELLPPSEFEKELGARESREKEVDSNPDFQKLMNSARKSISVVVPNISSESNMISHFSQLDKFQEDYDSGIEDAFLPGPCTEEQYDLTEYSSNESSNNFTYEYCYRNEKGEVIEPDSKVSVSFVKFLECEQRILDEKIQSLNPPNANSSCELFSKAKETRLLYCNSKKIPSWACDLEEVSRQTLEQKKSPQIFLDAFGVFKGINNLNLEHVLGTSVDGNSHRGESALWNTPENSIYSAKPRLDGIRPLGDFF